MKNKELHPDHILNNEGFGDMYRLDWWHILVKDRDNKMCTNCGSKDEIIAVPIIEDESLKFQLSNGITLCEICNEKYQEERK